MTPDINNSIELFYNLLPNSFTRKEAVNEIAPNFWTKVRTADKYLALLIKKKKLARRNGNYCKISIPLYNME